MNAIEELKQCAKRLKHYSKIPMLDGHVSLDDIIANVENEYLELPRDEDGAVIHIGDELIKFCNEPIDVLAVGTNNVMYCSDGCFHSSDCWKINSRDSMELIKEDANKDVCDYWGCKPSECADCKIRVNGEQPLEYYGVGNCTAAKARDLVARTEKLLGGGE